MKIDVFNHVFPASFLERMNGIAPARAIERWSRITTLHDMDARMRMLESFGDLQQIVSMSQPPLDEIAGPDLSPELARVANDGMAGICRANPDRFPGFIASLPMNNPAAAVVEIDRAVGDLGALGMQIHSNVGGKPLDEPEFLPVFARLAEIGRPVWLHPARPLNHPDYVTEEISRYDIYWALGWQYETSAAMARMVFSGMFDQLPGLKVMAHHWGAYIPHAEGKIAKHWTGRKSQSDTHDYPPVGDGLKRPAIDYFKEFYADTAMFGAGPASEAGLKFFGAGRSLFATDCPFDRQGGHILIEDTIEVVDDLPCSDAEREAIYAGNARELLGIG